VIWIYENLSKIEYDYLESLNPFMDYSNDGRSHIYNTSFAGWEIKNGIQQEIRKIRFFNLNQTKQGFICDDLLESRSLCAAIRSEMNFSLLNNKYSHIIDLIVKHKNNIWLSNIAIPVKTFIEYAVSTHKSLLDNLDIELLKEHNIDILEYIPIKHYIYEKKIILE